MPEYLAPGVYVEELPGQRTIEGVPTSTAAFVGVTERGPVEGPPVLVTSFGDFQRQFGGYVELRPAGGQDGEHGHLPLAVKQFFDNGGKRAFIARVFAPRPQPAAVALPIDFRTLELRTGVVARLLSTASPPMDHVFLSTTRGFVAGTSVVHRDGQASSPTVAINNVFPQTNRANLASALTETYRSDAAFATLTPTAGVSAKLVAREPGVWAERVRVQVRPYTAPAVNAAAAIAAGATSISVTSAAGFYRGGTVQIWSVAPAASANPGEMLDVRYATINSISGNTLVLEAPSAALPAYATPAQTFVATAEISVLVMWGSTVETFTGSWRHFDTTAAPPTGWTVPEMTAFNAGRSVWLRLHQRSLLVRLDSTDAVPPAIVFPTQYVAGAPLDSHPTTVDGAPAWLGPENGSGLARGAPDALPDFLAYVGNPGAGPGARSGLAALSDEETIAVVAIPGISDPRVQSALLSHCENEKYRFAVLDTPPAATIAAARAHRNQYDSSYGAIYYPWIQIPHPLTGDLTFVPPSGSVIGIYGRSDGERGVHKAPANEVVRNGIDLEARVSRGDQEVLNPEGINAIRDFRENQRGIRIWGARTLSSDPQWRYVSTRRLFLFIEHSIDKGTQWVVFEPNNRDLWGRVRRTIETFLETQWRTGALFGAKADQAFYVKCDESTMTPTDRANGKLVVEIGIAPTYPAEFVIFRISQITADTRAN